MATLATTLPSLGPLVSHFSRNASIDDIAAMAAVGLLSAAFLTKGKVWDRPDPHYYKWFERPQEALGAGGVAKATRNVAEKMAEMVSPTTYITRVAALDRAVSADVSCVERRCGRFLGITIRHRGTARRTTSEGGPSEVRTPHTMC